MTDGTRLPSWAALAMATCPRLIVEGRDHDTMMTEAPWAIPVHGVGEPSWAIVVSRRPDDVHGVVWVRNNLGALLDCCQAAMREVDRLRAELELAPRDERGRPLRDPRDPMQWRAVQVGRGGERQSWTSRRCGRRLALLHASYLLH